MNDDHLHLDHWHARWPWIGLAVTIAVLGLTVATVWWTGNW